MTNETKNDYVVSNTESCLLDADSLITVLNFCDVFDLVSCSTCGINIIEMMLRPNSLLWKRIKARNDVFFGQRMGFRLDAMSHCLKVRKHEDAYSFATGCVKSIYQEWKDRKGPQEISVIVTGNRGSGVSSVTECLRYGSSRGELYRLQTGTGRELRLLWRYVMFKTENNERPFQIKYKEIRGDMRASPFAYKIYMGRCSLVAVFSLSDRHALRRLADQFNYTLKTTKMKKGLFQRIPKVIIANKCDLPKNEQVIAREDAERFADQYSATLIWGSALTGWNMDRANLHALAPQYMRLLQSIRNDDAT